MRWFRSSTRFSTLSGSSRSVGPPPTPSASLVAPPPPFQTPLPATSFAPPQTHCPLPPQNQICGFFEVWTAVMLYAARPIGIIASQVFLGGCLHATFSIGAQSQSLFSRKGLAALAPLVICHVATALLWRYERRRSPAKYHVAAWMLGVSIGATLQLGGADAGVGEL